MTTIKNPFEYEAASKLSKKEIADFFIDNHNYARFVKSKRNVLFVGDRGSGKTMTLLYNSFSVQKEISENSKEATTGLYDIICIHIPCNTPLFHKSEHEILKPLEASVISEHFLVLSILYNISSTFNDAGLAISDDLAKTIKQDFEYVLDTQLPETSFWEAVSLFANKESQKAQRILNSATPEQYYESLTFASTIIPFLRFLRKIDCLECSHFSLMFDDIQDLNEHQIKTLNSWISFRDNSLFSFKLTSVKIGRPTMRTASGSTIIEGHDYIEIDMEGAYQNPDSGFGKLAREIVQKRLLSTGIKIGVDDYFPVNESFKADIDKCREEAEQEAIEKYGPKDKDNIKRIQDYVYKTARARYFRHLPAKANYPDAAYTGFDLLVHLSTGIVRNLLKPCYLMFDNSQSSGHSPEAPISPKIQAEIIKTESEKLWANMELLDIQIPGCTEKMKNDICNLFKNLMIHFRERIENEKASEPRAIKFTITEVGHKGYGELLELLVVAQRAQLLYTYVSSGKELATRKTYYVPNRMLLPSYGLDAVGQHAQVSLKTSVLLAAAQGTKIPYGPEDSTSTQQATLFD